MTPTTKATTGQPAAKHEAEGASAVSSNASPSDKSLLKNPPSDKSSSKAGSKKVDTQGGPSAKTAMNLVEKRMADAGVTEQKSGAKGAPSADVEDDGGKPAGTKKSKVEAQTEVVEASPLESTSADRSAAKFRPMFESVLSRTRSAVLIGATATRAGAGQAYARVLTRWRPAASQDDIGSTRILQVPPSVGHIDILESWIPAPEPVRAPLAELDAREVSAWFGDHQVLDRVSLTMSAGVITSLIGPSGCGKSTFLRILNRMHELIPAASLAGEVMLDGADIYDPDRRLVDARKSIGMVFQKPNPFPAMSIYDNVIAGLKLAGIHADRDRKDYLVESSLTKAGLWKEVRDRLRAPGGGLSGGQQQRLCIARSLSVSPRVLLMDEPCSALDPTSTRVIEETMLELASEVTMVIVTHNMQQAQRVSTQCAFFLASQGNPGGIVEHGSTEAMFSDPIDPRTHDYVNGVFG